MQTREWTKLQNAIQRTHSSIRGLSESSITRISVSFSQQIDWFSRSSCSAVIDFILSLSLFLLRDLFTFVSFSFFSANARLVVAFVSDVSAQFPRPEHGHPFLARGDVTDTTPRATTNCSEALASLKVLSHEREKKRERETSLKGERERKETEELRKDQTFVVISNRLGSLDSWRGERGGEGESVKEGLPSGNLCVRRNWFPGDRNYFVAPWRRLMEEKRQVSLEVWWRIFFLFFSENIHETAFSSWMEFLRDGIVLRNTREFRFYMSIPVSIL